MERDARARCAGQREHPLQYRDGRIHHVRDLDPVETLPLEPVDRAPIVDLVLSKVRRRSLRDGQDVAKLARGIQHLPLARPIGDSGLGEKLPGVYDPSQVHRGRAADLLASGKRGGTVGDNSGSRRNRSGSRIVEGRIDDMLVRPAAQGVDDSVGISALRVDHGTESMLVRNQNRRVRRLQGHRAP